MTITESVVLIRFPESGHAYQALSALRSLDESLTSLQVRGAAVAERRPDGTLHVPEQSDDTISTGTATGGLIGMLFGVLGGPLGLLLGFSTGALVGGVFDLDRATSVDGALALLSAQITPGSTVVIVEAVETTPEPLDQLAARFDATIERQPTAQVAAEVEAAASAAEAAQKEANRVLRERKRAEIRAKIDEKVETVKEKLHR
ncbi:DUF1269 domain-containing protein [Lentzea tibetensis]|uniref:DUF1269 domain-containing protein n=1 Tax=Lentzea tibetensis TaxID=2591470 RepID=A0A563EQF2_9PSEU|nr:DUF1269 domain-containing protein [Lentzea tibetensis]TWP49458.1 DUF1269 domain-containing protein [Lentzea tibetensis]